MGELCRVAINAVRESHVAVRSVDRNSPGYKLLKDSILSHGFIGAITVRKRNDMYTGELYYEIIDGLHRWQAAKELGETWISADVVDVSDEDVLTLQIMQSDQYVPTKPHQYAVQLKRILGINPHLTISEMARKLGRPRAWIQERLTLNYLVKAAAALVDAGKINLTNAYALAQLPPDEQSHWLDRAQVTQPKDFVPMAHQRKREIREAQRMRRLGYEDGIRGKLAREILTSQVHDEITVTMPSEEEVALSLLQKEKVKRDIEFLAERVKEIAEKQASGYKFDEARRMLHGDLVDYNKFRAAGDKIRADEPVFPDPPAGWDHVRSHRDGKYSYCRGDVLIHYTGRHWAIYRPNVEELGNLSFNEALDAMAFVEEHLKDA